MKPFHITTPIYYANAKIHMGNVYTAIMADVIARYKRVLWYDVSLSTGTDENGQKMVQAAEREGQSVKDFLDEKSALTRQVLDDCEISYTDFIRTTEKRHYIFVQSVLQKTYDNGDIYQGDYEWLYCVGCEAFKKESDLIASPLSKGEWGGFVCPDHQTAPQIIKEKNRFFRLSKYQSRLEQYFADHPDFLTPDYRYNEVKAFVAGGLEDFSISRAGNPIGIPLPFDPSSVTYIWYDALLNYLTVCVDHYDDTGNPIFNDYASVMNHTLGKDIARFHAIYRVGMLMAAWLEDYLPKREYIGGFFTVDGQKMSKTIGNTIYADELCRDYDRDAMVFYLLYDIPYGADGDFSRERFRNAYTGMLMGGWGNLVSRVTKLAEKQGITEAIYNPTKNSFLTEANALGQALTPWSIDIAYIETLIDRWETNTLLKERYALVGETNKYMQDTAPWTKLKDEVTKDDGIADLQHLLRVIKQLGLISAPFLTHGWTKLQTILGSDELSAVTTLATSTWFVDLLSRESLALHLVPDVLYQMKE